MNLSIVFSIVHLRVFQNEVSHRQEWIFFAKFSYAYTFYLLFPAANVFGTEWKVGEMPTGRGAMMLKLVGDRIDG